jgi:hypothetical protein
MTAQTPEVNLAAHFEDETNRAVFLEFLKERGYEVEGARLVNRLYAWQVTINDMTLVFMTKGFRVSASRYTTTQDELAQLLLAAQQYAASVNQANILAALQAMGFAPDNFSYDTAGALSFEIQVGG